MSCQVLKAHKYKPRWPHFSTHPPTVCTMCVHVDTLEKVTWMRGSCPGLNTSAHARLLRGRRPEVSSSPVQGRGQAVLFGD